LGGCATGMAAAGTGSGREQPNAANVNDRASTAIGKLGGVIRS
jgi:hypothetical protein